MWIVSKQARKFWIPSRQRFESASGLMKRRLVNTVGESEDNDSSVLSIKKKANAFTTQRENTKLINQTVTNRFQVVLNRPPHIRDPLPPYIIPTSDDRNDYIKIISWNVNGFRALLRNQRGMLDQMITRHEPDIICLQETKVQNEVVESIEHVLPNYSSIWNCATTKKGYSGTAIFLKNSTLGVSKVLLDTCKPKTLENSNALHKEKAEGKINEPKLLTESVSFDFEDWIKAHDGEGRTIALETDQFYLVNCYVPNSGSVRLDSRVNEWDPHLRQYLMTLNKKKPVILTGDLNVGHLDLVIHNPDAKHIAKQAALTPQERGSFSNLLTTTGFIDAFRFFHPEAKGQFSYWSTRLSARRINRGLRLDYFIASPELFTELPPSDKSSSIEHNCPRIVDSNILHEETLGVSDHCPILLVLKLK